jgi:hypothetical protein
MTGSQLTKDFRYSKHDVSGFESRHCAGLPELSRQKTVGFKADHDTDMSGQEKTVDGQIRRIGQEFQGRWNPLVETKHVKIPEIFLLRFQNH